MSQFKNSIMERQESKKSTKGLRSSVDESMRRCIKAVRRSSFGTLRFIWFIQGSCFEKYEAEKQGDGDAHHVEGDIADGAFAAGNG